MDIDGLDIQTQTDLGYFQEKYILISDSYLMKMVRGIAIPMYNGLTCINNKLSLSDRKRRWCDYLYISDI